MRHRDLGQLDWPLVLFGGPYSNLQATRALLSEVAARQATALCTGDVVAYCADPGATVAAIRRAGVAVVAGNCEIQLAAGAPDCGCGFDAGSACDVLSIGWFGYASARISDDDRAWMRGLPDIASFVHQGARYAVIHGGVTDVARFVWPRSDAAALQEEWRAIEDAIGPVDHVIAGHCGIPFLRDTAKGRWINAGVIGMPPHDGRQQTRYAILDGGEVQFHRLSYDVTGAVAAMEKAGLTQGYDRALRTGYWPSEDVLPDDLRVPSLANG